MNLSTYTNLIVFVIGLLGVASESPAARPNILFAISDDQSYPYASAYGTSSIFTPAFDRVAREGVLFTNAITASPGLQSLSRIDPDRAVSLGRTNMPERMRACFPISLQPILDCSPKRVTTSDTQARDGDPGISRTEASPKTQRERPTLSLRPRLQRASDRLTMLLPSRGFLRNEKTNNPSVFGMDLPSRIEVSRKESDLNTVAGSKKWSSLNSCPIRQKYAATCSTMNTRSSGSTRTLGASSNSSKS